MRSPFVKYMSKFYLLMIIVISLFCLIKSNKEDSLAEKLNVTINPKTITVSGLSSGGYMAGQFHLAHSAHIRGVAIFSAGPYFCSQAKFEKAMEDCMSKPENLDLDYLHDVARQHEKIGLLDSLENLKNSKVFVFIGLKDTRVLPGVSQKLVEFYESFQVKEIMTKVLEDSQHAYPTDDQSNNACEMLGSPFINYCGYPGALNALKFIGNPETFEAKSKFLNSEIQKLMKQNESGKGNLDEAVEGNQLKLNYNLDNLIEFPQAYYFNNEKISMNEKAFIYVPEQCKNKKKLCDLHVAFHGCKQTLDHIQSSFMEKTGYLEVAENFGIIMLFPQALISNQDPININGCWDFWGYNKPFEFIADGIKVEDNSYFGTKKGKQIAAVWRMIQDLTDISDFQSMNNQTNISHSLIE